MAVERNQLTNVGKGDILKISLPGGIVTTAEIVWRNRRGVVLEDSAGWRYRFSRQSVQNGGKGLISILEKVSSGQDSFRRSIDRHSQ